MNAGERGVHDVGPFFLGGGGRKETPGVEKFGVTPNLKEASCWSLLKTAQKAGGALSLKEAPDFGRRGSELHHAAESQDPGLRVRESNRKPGAAD